MIISGHPPPPGEEGRAKITKLKRGRGRGKREWEGERGRERVRGRLDFLPYEFETCPFSTTPAYKSLIKFRKKGSENVPILLRI